MNILIVGYGIVGKNLNDELTNLKPDIYDKYKDDINTKRKIKYDIAFICVDTPLKNDMLDTTEILNAINENKSEIYVIKSTCPLGTVDELKNLTGKRIIFSPEYQGDTQHCKNFEFNFTILGGDKEDCIEVIQALQYCYDGRHSFRITDSKTAELVKFMENSFLATKVSFCNQFYEICKKYNINYEELRELFILDKRLGESHTFVYKESPYWDSHCLNKDVPYIAKAEDAELLLSVCEYNKKQKEKYKKEPNVEENKRGVAMLNKITELLNLNYYKENGKTYIINPEDDTYTELEQDGQVNVFTIDINNQKVYCSYNDDTNTISIIFGKNKHLYIDKDSFYYSIKTDNDKKSISVANFSNETVLSIFGEKNNIATTVTVNTKEDKYNKMISKIVAKDEHGISKGETEVSGIDKAIAKNKFQQYDKDGKMLRGNLYKEELYLPTEVFVEQELDHNIVMQELLRDIEENMPALISLSEERFPIIKKLYDNSKKHFNK